MGKTSKEINVNNVAAVRTAVGDIVKKGTKCVGNNMMRFVTSKGQEWKVRNGVRANSLNTMELKVYGPEGVTFSSLKGFDKWIKSGALLPSEQRGKKGKTANKASNKPIIVNIDNDDADDYNEEQEGEEDEGEDEAEDEADDEAKDEDDVEEDDVAKEKEREDDPAYSDEEDWENAEWGEAMSDGEGERDSIDRLGPSTPDTPGAGGDGNVASKHRSLLNSRLPAANGKSASASAKRAKTRETTTSQNDTNDAWMTTISKFLTTFETHAKNEVTMQAVEEKIKYHSGELRKAENELANLKKVTDKTRKVSIEFRALALSLQEVFSHSFLFMCPSGDTNCLCIGFEHVFHQGVIPLTQPSDSLKP